VAVGDSEGWLRRDDVRDIPFPGERIRRGHPVCTVFARGPDSVTCYARLVEAARALEQELEGVA
jgi:predicted ATP-grasp superfamily ATP-dependent carboligase